MPLFYSFIIFYMEKEKASLKDLYMAFFKTGLFTFGGGIAMLPMLEKELVDNHKWCTYEDIMDYYAVGQCTPGIIAVNTATFVGYKHRGVAGAIVATAGIVTPSVIIITIIALFIRNFTDIPAVQHAIKGITAGVCAIIIPSIFKLAKNSIKSVFAAILAICAFLLAEFTSFPFYLIVICGIIAGIIYGKLGGSNK